MNQTPSRSWTEDWREAERLLCVRLDSMGDVLMSTPAIRALKQAVPKRHITLLTSPAGAEAAALVPEIDDVVVYQAPWMKGTELKAGSAPAYRMAQRLRAGSFDGAVIFTVYSQNPLPSAFLCHLADIPLSLAHCRENPYQLLSHWVRDWEPEKGVRHEVRRQLDLVAAIGVRGSEERLSLRVSAEARHRARKILDAKRLDTSSCWTVIHAGATAPSRRYPPEGFAAVARRLIERLGCQAVFTGTAEERGLVEDIRHMLHEPSIALAGELSLEELAAVIGLAPLLIANNSGPVHVAAAVGTPVVDLYALTNPQHTPWSVAHRVLSHDVACKFCYQSRCPEQHHDCLRLINPDEVIQAANELLAGRHNGQTAAGRMDVIA